MQPRQLGVDDREQQGLDYVDVQAPPNPGQHDINPQIIATVVAAAVVVVAVMAAMAVAVMLRLRLLICVYCCCWGMLQLSVQIVA